MDAVTPSGMGVALKFLADTCVSVADEIETIQRTEGVCWKEWERGRKQQRQDMCRPVHFSHLQPVGSAPGAGAPSPSQNPLG